jgi:hypothetical protein
MEVYLYVFGGTAVGMAVTAWAVYYSLFKEQKDEDD